RADQRDLALREAKWHPLLATAHAFSRWSNVDSLQAQEASGIRSTADMIRSAGLPPPHFHARRDAGERLPLASPSANPLDRLLQRRATCRNFDRDAALPLSELSRILHR